MSCGDNFGAPPNRKSITANSIAGKRKATMKVKIDPVIDKNPYSHNKRNSKIEIKR